MMTLGTALSVGGLVKDRRAIPDMMVWGYAGHTSAPSAAADGR